MADLAAIRIKHNLTPPAMVRMSVGVVYIIVYALYVRLHKPRCMHTEPVYIFLARDGGTMMRVTLEPYTMQSKRSRHPLLIPGERLRDIGPVGGRQTELEVYWRRSD
jgi:hypothetical protein